MGRGGVDDRLPFGRDAHDGARAPLQRALHLGELTRARAFLGRREIDATKALLHRIPGAGEQRLLFIIRGLRHRLITQSARRIEGAGIQQQEAIRIEDAGAGARWRNETLQNGSRARRIDRELEPRRSRLLARQPLVQLLLQELVGVEGRRLVFRGQRAGNRALRSTRLARRATGCAHQSRQGVSGSSRESRETAPKAPRGSGMRCVRVRLDEKRRATVRRARKAKRRSIPRRRASTDADPSRPPVRSRQIPDASGRASASLGTRAGSYASLKR